MTDLHPVEPRPFVTGHAAFWAWFTIALVPVGLVLVALTALMLGSSGAGGGSPWFGALAGLTLALVALAAPTVAVVVAEQAAVDGHASAPAAGLTARGLLALVVVLLLAGVVSPLAGVPAAAVAVGLAWVGVRRVRARAASA